MKKKIFILEDPEELMIQFGSQVEYYQRRVSRCPEESNKKIIAVD